MKPQSPHDDEFAFKSNIYLLIHQRSACERVVMENQSSDWHQLCSNIFRVCHCVQTLTQTLCVLSETGLPDPVIGSPGNWGLHTCKYVHTHAMLAHGTQCQSCFYLWACVHTDMYEYMDACMCAFVVHVFVFMHSFSGWSGISCSTVDGACSTLKMFNILIIQLPVKGGEMQREREQQGEGRDMFRPRPNNKGLHKPCTHTLTVTPSHSQCITHCSLMLYQAHILLTTQCHPEGRCFLCKTTGWKPLTLLCGCVWLCVSRSPLGDRLRAGRLSWEGGRVTLVTDMPKPDLLCLVQLLDGTIETFRVSVRKTHTHTQTHP